MVNVSWLGRGAINLTQQIERSRRLAVEGKKATKGGWHVVQADVVRSGGGILGTCAHGLRWSGCCSRKTI